MSVRIVGRTLVEQYNRDGDCWCALVDLWLLLLGGVTRQWTAARGRVWAIPASDVGYRSTRWVKRWAAPTYQESST